MKILVRLVAIMVLCVCYVGFGGTASAAALTQITPNQLLITQQDYGDNYPFTKEKGILSCKLGEVVFTVDGVPYAVNGTAQRTKENQPLENIWADNPAIPGTKKNVGGIISQGLALCQ